MPDTFSILTVCTGNVCRSPLAELLLKSKLSDFPEIRIGSAGIGALVGRGMTPQAQSLALSQGVPDPEVHRAKQLLAEMVQESSLVLAMDRSHRKAVAELVPRKSKCVFTVREFARLVGATSDRDLQLEVQSSGATVKERLDAAVEAARLSRSELACLPMPEEDDVVDPFGKSDQIYTKSGSQLIPAIDVVAAYLIHALSV
ncbi:low molecular weight phosphatase family protein [Corynebacterium sp. H128]|uniref:arsenate reductase/protein-tyrosine-phosphatase family protein n=1 Tax=Corynebacterium sp. H128 TaxID=3133427 RepID=UPI003097C62F